MILYNRLPKVIAEISLPVKYLTAPTVLNQDCLLSLRKGEKLKKICGGFSAFQQVIRLYLR